MRLAVVSPFVDRRHGTERAVAELVERLARDYSCEIHLYAQRVEDLEIGTPQTTALTNSGSIVWHRVPNVPGPHLFQFLAWVLLNSILRGWDCLRSGASYDLVLSPGINCLHPDLVIVHAVFHRLRELAHEATSRQRSKREFFTSLHRRMYYGLVTLLERNIYMNDRVALVAVSRRTSEQLKSYFDRIDVRVAANGVDSSQFSAEGRLAGRVEARTRWRFSTQDFVLLLIGNDWRVKGVPVILEAMGKLRGLPLQLLVAGSDDSRHYQSLARQLGVDEKCHWEKPRVSVLDFYSAADIFVSPSLEDSFGLPVAEAMACGLPVITSASAGIADYIRSCVDGFVLQEPRDAASLAELLQRLQSDVELRRRVGEAGIVAARRLTWDRHVQTIAPILKELQARKKAGRT